MKRDRAGQPETQVRESDRVMAMETPKKIGKYEVMTQIATGGFGVIYKGWDPFINRPVAIKTCATPDAEARERFHREAEFVGNLVHRNITLVFDFGVQEGAPWPPTIQEDAPRVPSREW